MSQAGQQTALDERSADLGTELTSLMTFSRRKHISNFHSCWLLRSPSAHFWINGYFRDAVTEFFESLQQKSYLFVSIHQPVYPVVASLSVYRSIANRVAQQNLALILVGALVGTLSFSRCHSAWRQLKVVLSMVTMVVVGAGGWVVRLHKLVGGITSLPTVADGGSCAYVDDL